MYKTAADHIKLFDEISARMGCSLRWVRRRSTYIPYVHTQTYIYIYLFISAAEHIKLFDDIPALLGCRYQWARCRYTSAIHRYSRSRTL